MKLVKGKKRETRFFICNPAFANLVPLRNPLHLCAYVFALCPADPLSERSHATQPNKSATPSTA